jgi:hypothetical protein
MFKRLCLALLSATLALIVAPAYAAPPSNISYTVGVCDPWFGQNCLKPTSAGTLSTAAFAPSGQTSLSVTNVSGRVALPTTGPTVLVQNTGSNTVYLNFGSASVVATTGGYPIQAGYAIAFAAGSNTYIAGITSSSTSTLAITTGTGVPAITGGGSGGGSGGVVTGNVSNGATSVAPTSTNVGTVAYNYVWDGSAWQRMDNSPVPVTQSGTWTPEILGADGSTVATVKAASTKSASTDTALVVATRPTANPICTSKVIVNQTGSTDLVTLTNSGYICSIVLVSASAQNISLVEGTGPVCATGITGMIGGTTASVALGANGGFSSISPSPWLVTAAAAKHICLLQSAAGNVSGVITYVDAS